MVKLIVLVLVIGFEFCIVYAQISKINSMRRDSILMNKIPTASPLGTWNNFSLLQCTTICLTDVKCTMVFYNSNLKSCKAYGLSFNAANVGQQSQIGWQFYHRNLNLKVCPTTIGYSYDQITNRCIRASSDLKTYADSRATCLAEGALLARVDNTQMWEFVKSVLVLTNTNDAYIQGELDQAGVWRYEDGTPINFLIWGSGQPGNSKYLDMWRADSYLFHDVSGNVRYGFVCEISLL